MTRDCPACGRTWDGRAGWCGACGAALGDDVAPSGGRRVLPPRLRPVASGLAGVVAVAMAWGLVLLVRPPSVPAPVRGDVPVLGGEVAVPSAPPTVEVDDVGVPAALLATCGDGATDDCVRWVQRAGQTAWSSDGVLVSTVGGVVVGLDPADGRRRWSATVTTPVTALVVLDDHTVLVEDTAGVTARDVADGDRRWSLPDHHLAATAPGRPFDDVVVAGDGIGTYRGVAANDGTELWTWASGLDPSRRSAAALPLPHGRIALVTIDGVRVVEGDTGDAVWTRGGGVGPPSSTVAVTDEYVVVAVAHPPQDAPVLEVRRHDGRLVARRAVPVVPVRQVAVTSDRLVLRSPDAVAALDLDDLRTAWIRDDVGARLMSSQPLAVPGRGPDGPVLLPEVALHTGSVVALPSDGTALVLDARTGVTVRVIGEPADGLRISAGFVTRRTLWRTDAQSLEAYDLPSGRRLLRLEVRATPTVVSDNPLVVSTAGRLVRVDLDAAPAGVQRQR